MTDMSTNKSALKLFIDLLLSFALLVIIFLGKIVLLEYMLKFLSVI